MKVRICDICRCNNKLGPVSWVRKVKSTRGESMRFELCNNHKDWEKGKTFEETMEAYGKLIDKPQDTIMTIFEKCLR